MIKIKSFVFNELGVNSFVLHDETGICIIVDPGCNQPNHQKELQDFIETHNLTPEYIVLTHGHFDHLAGLAWTKATYPCPVVMHEDDLYLLNNATVQADMFGIKVDAPPLPDRYIAEGEILYFGDSDVSILHVPGHSPGSICLYSETDSMLICGDVLFSGSIGRTDLFGGNYDQLISGIRKKLMILPRETVVWPGHGIRTTIGAEYDTNPFLS